MTEIVTIEFHTNKSNNDIIKNISELDSHCMLSAEPIDSLDYWIVQVQIDETIRESLTDSELAEMFGFDFNDIDFINEL